MYSVHEVSICKNTIHYNVMCFHGDNDKLLGDNIGHLYLTMVAGQPLWLWNRKYCIHCLLLVWVRNFIITATRH